MRKEKIVEPSSVVDLKAFVPAQDYDLAKQFYVDLGFTLNWAKPPALQPWGLRVLYLTDPTGVLWHIAEERKG
jgi:uncharacterized glyoxalase superfamily protein PhnB